MHTAGLKSYSLPRIVICKNGENCDTDETQSFVMNTEDVARKSDGDSTLKQVNCKSPNKTKSMDDHLAPAVASASLSSNPEATLANNLTGLHLGDNQEIVATKMPMTPVITESVESSSGEKTSPILEEKDEILSHYVGRIIGKGGETIRDLQARSGCHIDVNQNVEPGAPKIITYCGRMQEDIDLAKQLVAMLCTEDTPDRAELPLGRALMKRIQVPNSAIGRIIGRGGGMIRELQSKSQARIQIDHSNETASGMDAEYRQVTITGTKDSVAKAEDLIFFLSAHNPGLGDHDVQWISTLADDAATMYGGPYWSAEGQASYMGYGGPYTSQQFWNQYAASPAVMETDFLACSKKDIGHLIGRKGGTINYIQQRSNCSIQIYQQDCQISVTGPRQGIDMAKQLLQNIIERGLHRPNDDGQRKEQLEQSQQEYGYPLQQGYPNQEHGMAQQLYYGGPPMMMYAPQHHHFSVQQAQRSPWRSATTIDGEIYYFNLNTLETQWEKPAEVKRYERTNVKRQQVQTDKGRKKRGE